MKKLGLIIVLLCFSIRMNAGDFMFKHLEVKDGLSNNRINDIFKDSEGFMWFSTASGLNRYDGYQVKVFRSFDMENGPLPDNYILDVQEDTQNRLWIHTGAGYSIYDPQTEKFNRDVRTVLWEYGIDGTPDVVFIDKKKRMWFSIPSKGCYMYVPEAKLIYPLLFSGEKLPSGKIVDFVECGDGILAVYNNGLLVCLDKDGNQVKWQSDNIAREVGGNKSEVYKMYVDMGGEVWIYSSSGLWIYNPTLKKWNTQLANFVKQQTHSLIRSIGQDKTGRIWIGTDMDGIYILSKSRGEIKNIKNSSGDERSLQNNTITALYEDGNGIMWIGTHKKGISYYNESTFKFGIEHIGDINCIQEDNGFLWLGTNDGGLIRWDGKTGDEITTFKEGTGSLSANVVMSLLRAKNGKLWIGTFQGGLNCYENGRFTTYRNIPGKKNSLVNNNVWALAEDKEGNIWIGTLGGGVQCLNPNNGTFTTYDANTADLLSDHISSLYVNKENELLIGTAQGVSILDLMSRKINNLTGTKSGKTRFSNQNVTQVYEDSRGLIWVCTREGLNIYNQKSDELKIMSVEDGLSSQYIAGIVEDNNKNMWITTAKGITNIVVEADGKSSNYTYRCYVYDDKDGLQNCEFNQRSIAKLASGDIMMGGLYGINRFNPNEIKYNKVLPKVVFTNLALFNENIEIGKEYNGRVVLNKALNRVDELELNYNHNIFSIQFASDNYVVPEKVKYSYKLEGFNDEWLTINAGKVIFTNLAPGTYVLKVKAINSDGYAGTEESSLKIVIHPPFWLSIWAYIVYIILAISALILARYLILRGERNKFRMQQMEQESERIQEVNDMKIRFFTNISHELRTPLTLIISPLETLMKDYNGDNLLVDKLKMVQRNATRLLGLVNQLLDFKKSDVDGHHLSLSDGDVVSYVNTICTSFTDFSEKKDVRLTFYSGVPSLHISFDEDKIGKVVMNLLSNAFKFTHSDGRVDVSLELIDGDDRSEILEIKVIDTGIGIKDADKERIFERFYQIDNPNHEISGSGVGLSLVRDFVMLHGGKVFVLDNVPKGSVFVVRIPVRRSGKLVLEMGETMTSEDLPEIKTVDDIPLIKTVDDVLAEVAEEKAREKTKKEVSKVINPTMSVSGTTEGSDEEAMKEFYENQVAMAEEIDTVNDIKPQRALVIQLTEEEEGVFVTHVVQAEDMSKMLGPGRKRVASATARDMIGRKKAADRIEGDKRPLALVVDDNADFTSFMYDSLSTAYRVKLAENGREAWEIIPELMPDIIISDVMMSEMDGNELCQLVKSDERTANIPIILLTARQSDEYKRESLTMGADDYITKPFNMDVLSLRISKLLDLKTNNRRPRVDQEPSESAITSMDEKLIDNAVKYVESNISRSDLSVEELSRELGMSRVHLYKKLLAITGKTPIEFIRVIRLKRAAQLLRESQQNVSEIAYQVGFNNPKYFSKYFKDEFGILPSNYQEKEGR